MMGLEAQELRGTPVLNRGAFKKEMKHLRKFSTSEPRRQFSGDIMDMLNFRGGYFHSM